MMGVGEEENRTINTELILQGFGDLKELNVVLFLLFLLIYILTMSGNILIVVLVVAKTNLHTPMYFFLANFSCLETFYSSTILPKVIVSLAGEKTISIPGCIAQFYFFTALVVTELGLLALMSYDRYVAICKPLHYVTLMSDRLCLCMVVGAWLNGFLANTIIMYLMTRLRFCGSNKIDHFFCDLAPVAEIACNEDHNFEFMASVFSGIFSLPPFLLTLTSYTFIIISILRIPSATGRQKAFSTCSSHLIVVTIFYSTIIIVYVLPNSDEMKKLNKIFSLFYTILTPLVNPMVYSLRNREVKEAIRTFAGKAIQLIRPKESSVIISRIRWNELSPKPT